MTPGIKESKEEEERKERDQELKGSEATGSRALVARANYLALDRADIQYATKEVCRSIRWNREVAK